MDGRIILVSNRGPGIADTRLPGVAAETGKGGLVGALTEFARVRPVEWISAAMSDRERALAGGPLPAPGLGPGATQRFVAIDPVTFHDYYRVVANPLLWLIHHDLWPSHTPVDAAVVGAWAGYQAANACFATAVIAALDATPAAPVMLHDYHLYPLAQAIRAARPQAFLQFFLHIPWPAPPAWEVLPEVMRTALLQGVLANDIVGLQTRASVDNFMATVAALPGVEVDHAGDRVWVAGREVWVRHFPVSVDPARIRQLAQTPAVDAHCRQLADERFTIGRVDRADMSKNIVRGFMAFERLLERRPELRDRMRFLAILQDTRGDIPQYAEYRRGIVDIADHINAVFATRRHTPIELVFSDDLALALALFRTTDALLVNAVADGMNLVCKEAPLVNERDAVLILSRGVGAHEELGEAALSVDPFDLDDQADALETAFEMGPQERARRIAALRAVVERNDAATWVRRQLAAIGEKRAGQTRGSLPEPHDFPAPADLPL